MGKKNVLRMFRKAAQQQGGGDAPAAKKKQDTVGVPTYSGVGGAIRRDEFGNSYWLNEEQLVELAVLNKEIPASENERFWTEFRKLRARHGIRPDNMHQSSREKALTGSSGATYKPVQTTWSDPTKNKSFMSEWWTGWGKGGWGSWGGADRNEVKLAVAKRAIEVLLSVIDDTGHKLHMKFSDDHDRPVSYTDMRSNLVVVTAKPMLDGLEDGKALDIMSGFTMHEASHSKHTRAVAKTIEDLKPAAIGGYMGNVVEDSRIEALTSEEFPGFADYFEAAKDYMWGQGEPYSTQWGPDLINKMNSVTAITKWPEQYRQQIEDAKHWTPEWEEEFKYWLQWRDDYMSGKYDFRQTVENAIARLRDATEEEKQKGKGKPEARASSGEGGQANDEIDAQAKAEQEAEDFNEALRDFLEKNKDKLKNTCTHKDHTGKGEKVSAGANENIGKLVDDEVEWEKPKHLTDGMRDVPSLIITKPKEDHRSKNAWDGKADPMSARLRAALVFRPDKEIHSTKLLKRGKVDGTQLHRWAIDDWRMFMEKGRKVDPHAYVYLLVDLSGSMAGGGKLQSAQRLSKLFITALSSMDGVTPKVFGHTGDVEFGESSVISRLWQPGDPMTRLGLIQALPHGNNYDGFAIQWVGEKLASESRNNEQRLLIVLSDGYPAGSSYGGPSAQAHVRAVVDDLRKRHKIRTLQIAIDDALDAARQGSMFDEYIPYAPGDSLDAVPRRLTKWLEKVL